MLFRKAVWILNLCTTLLAVLILATIDFGTASAGKLLLLFVSLVLGNYILRILHEYPTSQSKSEAFKYMSLRDNVPHRVVSTGTKKKADIFIVISGSGTEKNCKSGETRVVGKGSVLGAVDMFENYNNPDYLEPEEPVTYISTLKKGCLVRLRLCDFIMSQYGPKVDKEAEYLASLPAEEQLIYSTRKFATKAISPGLFSILDANDLLPTDPSDNSFKYLCTGNINRRLELRRGDPPSVFIIMKGSVTVALMRHMRSILALKDEDDSNSIAVKVLGSRVDSLGRANSISVCFLG